MENLKENIKEIEKTKKEIYKLEKQIDGLENIKVDLYHNNYEQFTKNDKLQKKYKNKIELLQIKIAILKNNLHYLLKMDFEGIKENIIFYYENKKIGEKTKEKIENEIKDYYRNNFSVNIGCYLSFDNFLDNYSMILTFYFLNDEGYRGYLLQYNEEFKITLEKRKYNNYELSISYYNNINDYVEIKNTLQKAKELQKEYTKTTEKIEKLRLQQKELYHNFTDYLHGFLYNKLDIKTDLRIY